MDDEAKMRKTLENFEQSCDELIKRRSIILTTNRLFWIIESVVMFFLIFLCAAILCESGSILVSIGLASAVLLSRFICTVILLVVRKIVHPTYKSAIDTAKEAKNKWIELKGDQNAESTLIAVSEEDGLILCQKAPLMSNPDGENAKESNDTCSLVNEPRYFYEWCDEVEPSMSDKTALFSSQQSTPSNGEDDAKSDFPVESHKNNRYLDRENCQGYRRNHIYSSASVDDELDKPSFSEKTSLNSDSSKNTAINVVVPQIVSTPVHFVRPNTPKVIVGRDVIVGEGDIYKS